MALNIKNTDVEKLATEVAELTRESKTEAIRQALLDRKRRLMLHRGGAAKRDRLRTVLESRIWPAIPASLRGQRISKEEREEILGYGPHGV